MYCNNTTTITIIITTITTITISTITITTHKGFKFYVIVYNL